MKQKTKIALYLFLFFFPIVYIVGSFLYMGITSDKGYERDEILTSKSQCVTKYYIKTGEKIRNAYVIENLFSQKMHNYYHPLFLFNKGVFLEYNVDSKDSDTTVDISFNKNDKALTVTHNINSANIIVKKDKMHGIKIKYITNNSESEND
jgi:hypothetical protein